MPAKTRKQQKFFAMCSTPKGRKQARAKCPSVKVAKEFRNLRGKTRSAYTKAGERPR